MERAQRAGRWHLAQDIALACLVGVFALAEVWVPLDSVTATGSPVVTTIGIAVEVVLLALRRRIPIVLVGIPIIWTVLAITTGGHLQVAFWGQLVALCIALYSIARHGTPREIAIVAGSAAVMLILGDLFLPPLRAPEEIVFHWGVCLAVFGAGLGLRASEQRAVAAAVRTAEAEAAVREQTLRAIAEERARIARELHDILGHSVSVMVIQAGAAVGAVGEDDDVVRQALETIRSTGSQSLGEVRRVVALLRDDEGTLLQPLPGVAELSALIVQARADGIRVEFSERGDQTTVGTGQGLAVYRIVQEALTNVRKHAAEASARVDVSYRPTDIEVTVTDSGAAPSQPGSGGHGLIGMRERVAVYGGSIEIGPDAASGGWRVHAVIPAAAAPRHESIRDAASLPATATGREP
jgi:signal transduction histidine kinase